MDDWVVRRMTSGKREREREIKRQSRCVYS